MAVAGGIAYKALYYVIMLVALVGFISGVLSKAARWGDVVVDREESDEDPFMPDVYMCLDAHSSNLVMNQALDRWSFVHGQRHKGWNDNKRCQGIGPSYYDADIMKGDYTYPCMEMGVSTETVNDWSADDPTPNSNPSNDGYYEQYKGLLGLYKFNDQEKWTSPDSVATQDPADPSKIFRSIKFASEDFTGTTFDASKYKPDPFSEEKDAKALAEQWSTLWRDQALIDSLQPKSLRDMVIKSQCFSFKAPKGDGDEPGKVKQSRKHEHVAFNFNLALKYNSDVMQRYMHARMWFMDPGSTPTKNDRGDGARKPDLEVPLGNAMNYIKLTPYQYRNQRENGLGAEFKTNFKADLQSNNQRIWYPAPDGTGTKPILFWSGFTFELELTEPIAKLTKRNRSFGEITADIGGVFTTFFVIFVGVFFGASGLVNANAQPIMVFQLIPSSWKARLLKKQSLFQSDVAVEQTSTPAETSKVSGEA